MSLVLALLGELRASLRTRTDLAFENLALRQQLVLLRRRSKRPQFGRLDRLFWVWLLHQWAGWRETLHVVRPQTVICWLSFAKILSQRLDDDPATCQPGRQCPSYSPCWARCVRRSEPALTLRSKIWRCDNNSSCFAARSDRNSGASIVSSGCGSPTSGRGGARRYMSFAHRL